MSKDSRIRDALAPVEASILKAAGAAAGGLDPTSPPRGVSLFLLSCLQTSGHIRWDKGTKRYRLTWGGAQRLVQLSKNDSTPFNPVIKEHPDD